jgi:hypothetical protein
MKTITINSIKEAQKYRLRISKCTQCQKTGIVCDNGDGEIIINWSPVFLVKDELVLAPGKCDGSQLYKLFCNRCAKKTKQ